MDKSTSILRVLQMLEKRGIRSTKDFEKDLEKLVKENVMDFLETFYKDFIRMNFDSYNRFEILRNLSKSQKQRLRGQNLRRYEYRKNSNLKCIFIIDNDNNKNMPIILCAFNEDGDKKKGKNSYKDNIERAITIFEKINGG